MKRFLIAIAITLISGLSFAQSGIGTEQLRQAGFDNLSESQKADLVKQIARSAPTTPEAKVEKVVQAVEKADKWVDLGAKIGSMIGGAAKEVGIAVNDFVQTPVGKWAMILIIFHYAGGAIVHVAAGAIFFTAGLLLAFYIYRRGTPWTYEYDTTKTNWRGAHPIKQKVREKPSDEVLTTTGLIAFFTIVVTLFTVFTW